MAPKQFEIEGDLLGWDPILGDDKLWNEIGPDPESLQEDPSIMGLLGSLGWNPIKAAGRAAERAAGATGRFAGNVATLPVRMSVNLVKGAGQGIYRGIRPSRQGGGGAPADGGGEEAPADGGGEDETSGQGLGMTPTPTTDGMYYMSGEEAATVGKILRGAPPHKRRHIAQRFVQQYNIGGIKDPTKHPMGKLLVSATPGGVTALAAKGIAEKALKNGNLKPAHLKKAGQLTKAGRTGDPAALAKIAAIKRQAATGDPAAEKALDTVKIAQCIQTGRSCGPQRLGLVSSLTNLRRLGEQNIAWRQARR